MAAPIQNQRIQELVQAFPRHGRPLREFPLGELDGDLDAAGRLLAVVAAQMLQEAGQALRALPQGRVLHAGAGPA